MVTMKPGRRAAAHSSLTLCPHRKSGPLGLDRDRIYLDATVRCNPDKYDATNRIVLGRPILRVGALHRCLIRLPSEVHRRTYDVVHGTSNRLKLCLDGLQADASL